MSTDDLTRRARARADEPWPLWDQDSPALLIELADALEELQGERDRWKARWQATVADADAARAALERVQRTTPSSPAAEEMEGPMNDASEVRETSATGGQKGSKDRRYDLVPVGPMDDVARLYAFGAKKYAAHNWRKGYDWHLSYAAAQRHLTQFWNGEDVDEETGLPHLAAVVFHSLALMEFAKSYPEGDNRPPPSGTLYVEEPEPLFKDRPAVL